MIARRNCLTSASLRFKRITLISGLPFRVHNCDVPSVCGVRWQCVGAARDATRRWSWVEVRASGGVGMHIFDRAGRWAGAPLSQKRKAVAVGFGLLATLGFIAGCSRSNGDRGTALAPPRAGMMSTRVAEPRALPQASSPARVSYAAESFGAARVPQGGGTYKIGKPYTIAGRWYFPQEDPGYDRRGVASWYGADFHGKKTANGEIYNVNALTAAHPTLPIPSFAYVTSIKTGRTVLVRVNDRGPYAKDRIMDLSRRTAEALGIASAGISEVRVKYAGRAPLDGNDRQEQRFLAEQPWASSDQRVAMGSGIHAAPVQSRGAEWRGRMGLMRAE